MAGISAHRRVGFRRLTQYAPIDAFNLGSSRPSNYWTAVVKDDDTSFDLIVDITSGLAAAGGETVTLTASGTAAEGTFWDYNATATQTFSASDEFVTFQIDLTDITKYFHQREVIFTITSASGVEIHPALGRCRLQIEPSTPPPLVAITSSGGSMVNNGDTVTVDFELQDSGGSPVTCHDDVEVWFTKEGALADNVTHGASGSTVISGSSTGSVVFTYDSTPGATNGDTCTVKPDYQTTEVRYTNLLFNPITPPFNGTGKFDRVNDIYEQQNLWTYGNEFDLGVQETRSIVTRSGSPLPPHLPGYPTNNQSGGTDAAGDPDFLLEPTASGAHANVITPTDGSAPTDPWTGLVIKWWSPDPLAAQSTPGFPYQRQAFDMALCGGDRQLHSIRKWVRGAYRIADSVGTDAASMTEFHRIGVRIRTKDRNHGVVIASDRGLGNAESPEPGYDHEGNAVTIYNVNGVDYWFWDQYLGHSTDFDWGIELDEDGHTMFWFIHHVDVTEVYPESNDAINGGKSTYEDPAEDDGNPIYYATWHGSDAGLPRGNANEPITSVAASDSGNKLTRSSGSWAVTGYLIDDVSATINIGDSSVPINGGTGVITEGDLIRFPGDSTEYTCDATTGASATSVSFTPDLVAAPSDNDAVTIGYASGDKILARGFTGDNGVMTVGSGVTSTDLPISDVNLGDEVAGAGKTVHRLGSTASNYEGVQEMKDNDRGTPIFNVWLEMSDDTLSGKPLRYWPNPYQKFTPRGLGMMVDAGLSSHTFTYTGA